MQRSLNRRTFAAGTAAAFASIAFVRAPARAAQFEYKAGHDLQADNPFSIRFQQMFDRVKEETGGRLSVTVFPNSQLGGQTAMLTQMRSGAIQFLATLDAIFSTVVPVAAIDSVGFAFKSGSQAVTVMDGPLGRYVRDEYKAKGIIKFLKMYDLGMRQMTSSTHPIAKAEDFNGFKMRTPPSQIAVDLFTALGASPTPITAGEIYTSAQTHIIDGLDFPLVGIESFKLFEVQKYVSLTNHVWSGYTLAGNAESWAALPEDLKAVVLRNQEKYALLQRRDTVLQNAALAQKLKSQGMTFNDVDNAPMKAKLGAYYGKWKGNFGATAWGLLENSVGKLG